MIGFFLAALVGFFPILPNFLNIFNMYLPVEKFILAISEAFLMVLPSSVTYLMNFYLFVFEIF